ncbi:MAG: transglutaminase, partial [Halobacteriales archaeon]
MSATPEDATGERFVAKMTPSRTTRQLALASAVVLLGAYLSVLWEVTGVAGGRGLLVPVVFVAVVAGVASATRLAVRTALWIGAGSFLLGGAAYLVAIPEPVLAGATFGRVVQDAQVLATGNIQVVQIIAADVWAAAMAPAPVYLTLFLAIRHRYDLASIAGGSALGFVALTGDAGTAVTLVGATSVLAMLGFGALESVDLDWKQIQDLGIVLAAGVVIARTVRVVPASGFADGPSPAGGGTDPTLESGLFSTGNRASILGSINLSPEPRFTVRADQPALWHAGAYDRYTGENWVRSGRTREYRSALLPNPPGRSRRIVQRFTVQSTVATVPGAWRPVDFAETPAVDVEITSEGGLEALGAHEAGDSYAIVSEIPAWDPETLRSAGTDYPGAVTDRYLQVPEDLSGRVARKANEGGGGADTPYGAAAA